MKIVVVILRAFKSNAEGVNLQHLFRNHLVKNTFKIITNLSNHFEFNSKSYYFESLSFAFHSSDYKSSNFFKYSQFPQRLQLPVMNKFMKYTIKQITDSQAYGDLQIRPFLINIYKKEKSLILCIKGNDTQETHGSRSTLLFTLNDK